MALGAVVAAALTDHSARVRMLTIGGLDVIKQPGMAGNGYGVPIESIVWTERGPNDCSELAFVLEDPQGVVSFDRSAIVQMRNITDDVIEFTGFLATISPQVFEPSGRSFVIKCVGAEKVLDWAKLPAMSLPAGMGTAAAVQLLAASCVNGTALPLNTLAQVGAGTNGTKLLPIGSVVDVAVGAVLDSSGPLAITAGTTLREGIRAVLDDNVTHDPDLGAYLFTVGPYAELRVWSGNQGDPDDWATLQADSDAPFTGAVLPQDLTITSDFMGNPTAAYVIGAAGASVVIASGEGPGDTALISDTTLDSSNRRTSAGQAYLAQVLDSYRGSFTAEDGDTVGWAFGHPGGMISIVNSRLGFPSGAALSSRIAEVVHTYPGGVKENWRVGFGGTSASIGALMRRLTRTLPN